MCRLFYLRMSTPPTRSFIGSLHLSGGIYMARGRPTKLLVSEEQLRQELLDRFIDEDGHKVPIRDIFSDIEFMKKTGLYGGWDSILQEPIPVVMGTAHYWVNKKLKMDEKYLYDYYFEIGLVTESFEEWSRLKNKRKGSKDRLNIYLDAKQKMIDYFQLDKLECLNSSINDLKVMALNKYIDYGYEGSDFEEDYLKFKKENNIKDRDFSETRANSISAFGKW